jgi:serine/threonine protein kinase
MEFDGPLLKERYRLGPKLGTGGQGSTFLAHDTGDSDREVVVKQLRLGEGGSWKRFDLFEREARVLQQLEHRGIPKFIDHFEGEAGKFYLVMARAPGRTLKDIGRFDEDDLRSILVRALGILAYLHNLKPPVIHRDVKPANLLRTDDGRLTLVDFGGVREALRESGGSTVVGTFGYMAPEQLHGQATPATDIYALGATIVALAGGIEPEDVPRRGLRMDLQKHLPRMSKPFVAMLEQMTLPDPEKRPQSAKEVLKLLPQTRALARTKSPDKTTTPPTASTSEELLELDLPGPLRVLVGLMLRIVGFGGNLALMLVQRLALPIVFTVISAFLSADSKKKLSSVRDGTNKALTGARTGFKRLQRGAGRRRALPPKATQKGER